MLDVKASCEDVRLLREAGRREGEFHDETASLEVQSGASDDTKVCGNDLLACRTISRVQSEYVGFLAPASAPKKTEQQPDEPLDTFSSDKHELKSQTRTKRANSLLVYCKLDLAEMLPARLWTRARHGTRQSGDIRMLSRLNCISTARRPRTGNRSHQLATTPYHRHPRYLFMTFLLKPLLVPIVVSAFAPGI